MSVQSQIKFRSDTAANWASTNPILADGELGFETDTGKPKIGNGVGAWNSLDYIAGKYTVNDLGDALVSSPSDNDVLLYSSSGWQSNSATVLGRATSEGYVLLEKVIYASSTTISPAENVRAMKIIAIGGGGGSGGVAIGATSAGGSGANYAESFVHLSGQYAPSATKIVPDIGSFNVVVGAGGAAGTDTPSSGTDGSYSGFSLVVPDAIISADGFDQGEQITYTLSEEYSWLIDDGYVIEGSCIGVTDASLDPSSRADAYLIDIVDIATNSFTLIDTNQEWDLGLVSGTFDLTIHYCRASGGNGGLAETVALTAPDFESGTAAYTSSTENMTYGDLTILGQAGQFAAFETTADFYHAKPGASAMFPITISTIARTTTQGAGFSAGSTNYGAGAFGAVSPAGSAKVGGGAGIQGVVIIEYYA